MGNVKRPIIVAALAFVMVAATASPALAQIHGERCRDVYIGQNQVGKFCVSINEADSGIHAGFLEGLVRYKNPQALWQVDWVHLYADGDLVRSTGSTGWMNGNSIPSFSTAWWPCPAGLGRTTVRAVFRARARNSSATAYSVWHHFDTPQVVFLCQYLG